MDEEVYAFFKERRNRRAEHHAVQRRKAPRILGENMIEFTSHNEGAHLRIPLKDGCVVDFWPGPGKWKCGSVEGLGIKKLVEFVKRENL